MVVTRIQHAWHSSLSFMRGDSRLKIDRIRPEDDRAMRRIIEGTRLELGVAGGEAWAAEELQSLSKTFRKPGNAFFVLRHPKKGVVGGAGFVQSSERTERCILRGLYLDRESRGSGLGETLLMLCLEQARGLGYRDCIAGTRAQMPRARRLYERLGFQLIALPNPSRGKEQFVYRRDLSRPLLPSEPPIPLADQSVE